MDILRNQSFILLCLLPFVSEGQEFFINGTSASEKECKPITVQKHSVDTIVRGEYPGIKAVSIKNDCLELDIFYGGGCGRVNCRLITNNRFMESLPPKINFTLKFEDQDPCEAMIAKKIHFDLSQYKGAAQNAGLIILINMKEYGLTYKPSSTAISHGFINREFLLVTNPIDSHGEWLNFINDSICIHSIGSILGTTDDTLHYELHDNIISFNKIRRETILAKSKLLSVEMISTVEFEKNKNKYTREQQYFIPSSKNDPLIGKTEFIILRIMK